MKKTTTPSETTEVAVNPRNEAIQRAYFALLSEVKSLIKFYPTDYLRTFFEIDYSSIALDCKHGFYSPMLHLRLEEHQEQLTICFAKNFTVKQQVGNYLDSLLTRSVYKHTAESNTEMNIEDALNVCVYNVDDYRQAKHLMDRGFKDCQKVTVELAEAA